VKKKLLHVIDSLGVGGAERLLVGIINDLPEYENHLIILNGPETLLPEINGLHKFTKLTATSFPRIFLQIPRLRKYIRDNKIDIVHSHLFGSNLATRWATPSNIPLINSIHAISSMCSYEIHKYNLYLEKWSYKKRHNIISVSKAVEDDFEKWVGFKGNHTVLYNFIEDKYFATIPKDHFSTNPLRLVAVGNLRLQKNYPYLIEAFKKAPANVSLDIYGEGGMRKELQDEIDAHGLKIRLLGLRDDLEQKLLEYDAFVMSSFYEGQPVSLLESMACGLPPVLADIPVLREVAGEKAIYFDIGNTDDFIKRIQEIQHQKYDLAQLAITSRERVNSFARRSEYMEKLKGLYKKYAPQL
jgi:glycosyltransferase involved in cell wall biosynthesis